MVRAANARQRARKRLFEKHPELRPNVVGYHHTPGRAGKSGRTPFRGERYGERKHATVEEVEDEEVEKERKEREAKERRRREKEEKAERGRAFSGGIGRSPSVNQTPNANSPTELCGCDVCVAREKLRDRPESIPKKPRRQRLANLYTNKGEETPWVDVECVTIPSVQAASSCSRAWTKVVEVMKESRERKEQLLRARSRLQKMDKVGSLVAVQALEGRLDRLDRLEVEACETLFGAFAFLTCAISSPRRLVVSKAGLDVCVEEFFGSLDKPGRTRAHYNPGEGFPLVHFSSQHASLVFSFFLAKKVWVPVPWRKFDGALRDFVKRVATTERSEPVDEAAVRIATTILESICEGQDPGEFRDVEPVPDSACVELSKQEGGKREAMYIRKDMTWRETEVRPQAIYTGGKIRVITIDSGANVRYNWINKYLGACFRRLPCSIFGGDVADWFERNKSFLELKEGEVFVSGDLESATDLFDRRITEALIDRLCSMNLGLTEADAEQMKAFTTRASLQTDFGTFSQLGGQLMGSVISFPLLCILSLTAYVLSPDARTSDGHLVRDLLLDPDRCPKENFAALCELRRVGVNGDDIVFPSADGGLGWVKGVGRIGGRVSRGKSLASGRFFTVNSELWTYEGGKVNCLRPSLITALTGDNRYFISPAREWKEFRNQDLVPERACGVWNLVEKLNLDIPPAWGGVGLVDRSSMLTRRPEHVCQVRRVAFFEALAGLRKEANLSVLVGSEAGLREAAEKRRDLERMGPRVLAYVSKPYGDAFSAMFRAKKASWHASPTRLVVDEFGNETRERLEIPEAELRRLARAVAERVVVTVQNIRLGGEQALSDLKTRYTSLLDGTRLRRIPIVLLGSFYARPLQEVAAAKVEEARWDLRRVIENKKRSVGCEEEKSSRTRFLFDLSGCVAFERTTTRNQRALRKRH